jgi:protoporphyrinogen oxidase
VSNEPVIVLGSGMGALGAASHVVDTGLPVALYDANSYPGGHTATFSVGGGFLFDDGPHVSFTKDERIRDLLARNVDGAFEDVKARINNYWHGTWIPHPVQMHLHGLPTDLIVSIISDFVSARETGDGPVDNYEEWLRVAYGDTFAEAFPMVYGRKYHTTTMDRLTTDWLGPRMYRPSLDELLRGALGQGDAETHYVTSFRYPSHGGFQSYLQPMFERLDPRLGCRVTAVDPAQRTVGFADGTVVRYDRLISSIPLPDFVPMVSGAPDDVTAATQRLSFSSAVMVNLGVARDDISDAHISYVYDEDVIFPRLNFPHLLSPGNVPRGAGSIQAELYFSDRYHPLRVSPESLIDVVISDLVRIGVLRETDQILVREARLARYANVIYDHDRAAAVETIHGYLDDVGIAYCGRYGDWNHSWTDESYLSGEGAAEAALAGGRRGDPTRSS